MDEPVFNLSHVAENIPSYLLHVAPEDLWDSFFESDFLLPHSSWASVRDVTQE